MSFHSNLGVKSKTTSKKKKCYVYTTLKSTKWAIALCLKKQCTYLNLKILWALLPEASVDHTAAGPQGVLLSNEKGVWEMRQEEAGGAAVPGDGETRESSGSWCQC